MDAPVLMWRSVVDTNCGFADLLLLSLVATACQLARVALSSPPACPVKPLAVLFTCSTLRSDTEPAAPIDADPGVTQQ